MVDRVQQIVATLPELTDVSGVCEVAERRLAEADAAFVAELGIALAERDRSVAGQVWQYGHVFDHLLRLLATTPGQKNAEQALRLVAAARSAVRNRDPYAASLLASGQRPEDLAVVFAGGGVPGGASEELRACLVHEMVLRGVAVTEAPGIARWASSPHWRRHRLGWLPLSLSSIEEAPYLPRYSAGPISDYSRSFGPSEGPGLLLGRALTARVPAARETTTPSMASAMAVAVAAGPRNPTDISRPGSSILPGPLMQRWSRTRWQRWALSACAGSPGGAGSRSLPARLPGHGKRSSWRPRRAALTTGVISGLTVVWRRGGPSPGSPVPLKGRRPPRWNARYKTCDWFSFDADTDWFDQVAWDIGLAAVRPGRQRLAVLAATDTD